MTMRIMLAGTIGGEGGNAAGVAGVNWNITMISTKFLGPNGGSTSDAIEALDYLTNLKARYGLNIVATNNSWGGGGFSQSMLDAINRSGDADILFAAAAGNGNKLGVGLNNDTTPFYPASLPRHHSL
jgi:thermitase